MYCECDRLTGRCVICDVPDAFCGSLRNCPGAPQLVPLPLASEADSTQAADTPTHGPGTELKKLLAKVGIVASPDCSCNGRAAEMDRQEQQEAGWCERNIDTIVGWLREQAEARGLPFLDLAGRVLVRRAIRNARSQSS